MGKKYKFWYPTGFRTAFEDANLDNSAAFEQSLRDMLREIAINTKTIMLQGKFTIPGLTEMLSTTSIEAVTVSYETDAPHNSEWESIDIEIGDRTAEYVDNMCKMIFCADPALAKSCNNNGNIIIQKNLMETLTAKIREMIRKEFS